MPISMERFESVGGTFLRLPPPFAPRTVPPFHRECHYCGYDVTLRDRPPRRCPKCGGSAWDEYSRRRALLAREEG